MALYTQTQLIRRAYRLLEDITPLPIDCGLLCGHACCQGDEHTGMWLLPGEEAMFEARPGFSVLPCEDNNGSPLLVCKGSCERSARPFACRIFPLFPLVKETAAGALTVEAALDPRAGTVCPLCKELTSFHFQRRVRQAAIVLLGNAELRRYLIETSAFLEELRVFQRKLLGK